MGVLGQPPQPVTFCHQGSCPRAGNLSELPPVPCTSERYDRCSYPIFEELEQSLGRKQCYAYIKFFDAIPSAFREAVAH